MARSKKIIPELLPMKKWLSRQEALAYMDMGETYFQEMVVAERITVSAIGTKHYYKLSDLDALFEKHTILKTA